MRTSTPLWLLVALGAVSLMAARSASAADPSQWKCETCPFEKASTTGTVDAGIGYVSDEDSPKQADYTGLDEKGAFAIAGATLRHRGDDGYYTDFMASDLGLDIRSLDVKGGREGSWSYRAGYSEIPRHLSDGAASPFLGIGGSTLTLPAGFPAGTTAAMPLAATLQPVEIDYKRSRADLGGTLLGPGGWQFRADVRHEVRDGTQRAAGSFFSTTSQLVAPLDQTTDQIEAVAEYAGKSLQAAMGYRGSMFRNGHDALTWQNPFTPVSGGTTGQLALAPDNEYHELFGTVGYQFTPGMRASGDLAFGRMSQNQAFLAPTLNPAITLPAMPATSLDGEVDTLDATVRLTATPMDKLRLAASLIHNERDNKTSSLAYQQVSTDMFIGDVRTNRPYSFTRNRAKLEGDWRGSGWKMAGGIDYDAVERTLQETEETNESTVWARGGTQLADNFGLTLKLQYGERDNDGYVVVPSTTPQNPLMRKYNQADRQRGLAEVRADWTISETMSVSFNFDVKDDDYTDSPIGLTSARSTAGGVDFSFALSDETRFRAYLQGEEVKSALANSQQFAQPDWSGTTRDQFETMGLGVTHLAMGGKLELGGDYALSRSSSDTKIHFGSSATPFPRAKTQLDSLTVSGQWHQNAKLTWLGSIAYERYESGDWHLDGVAAGTVPNLLAFGEKAPNYSVGVLRLAVRYRF